jgi:hypothetical protein
MAPNDKINNSFILITGIVTKVKGCLSIKEYPGITPHRSIMNTAYFEKLDLPLKGKGMGNL